VYKYRAVEVYIIEVYPIEVHHIGKGAMEVAGLPQLGTSNILDVAS
jgi:hypothetical protein